MCGIIGCLLREGAVAPVIVEGLKYLEYRGYDSVGVATVHDGKVFVKKDSGKLADVDGRLKLSELPGKLGLGHTRWATHGYPWGRNAHPHVDCSGKIVVVHNGIIQNFAELKEFLVSRGHVYRTHTDTEVIPHLIEHYMDVGFDFVSAVMAAINKLDGSFALAIACADYPDTLIGVRKESPLVVGLADNAAFVASDAVAFLKYTRKAIYLDDWQVAVITPAGLEVFNGKFGLPAPHEVEEIGWTFDQAQKGGYAHFMLKEIHEQPMAIAEALRTPQKYVDMFVSELSKARIVFIVGAGTSYHAALFASYIFPMLSDVVPIPVVASEFVNLYGHVVSDDTLVFAISQSGETADTLEAVRHAARKGSTVVSLVNVMGSALTKLSKVYLGQNSGPEISVVATKTYTGQLATLCRVALNLGLYEGKLRKGEANVLLAELAKIPKKVSSAIRRTDKVVKRIANRIAEAESVTFLGRGVNFTTAREARLKMLEISYKPAVAVPSGEVKHGYISLVEEGYPVVIVSPLDESFDRNVNTAHEVKARGAYVVMLTERGADVGSEIADVVLELPRHKVKMFTPMAFIVPLQLLAYYTAVRLNLDPDKPRNLAKSVTVI